MDVLDTVIVGAGWAGLAVSHALMERGVLHKVLERGHVGETWRTQRWDSFHMNTDNTQTVMPGEVYAGSDPDGAMPCRDFIALLEAYVRRHGLPVETACAVSDLSMVDGLFRLALPDSAVRAKTVVVATSTQSVPIRPPVAGDVPEFLDQIDSSSFRNGDSLKDGAILVVGSGQSGGQIADDLVRSGRKVFLSTSRVGRLPRNYRGRHVMRWLISSGFLDVPRAELLRNGPIPARALVGARETISLQSLSAQGVVLLGRLTGSDGRALFFSDDVENNLEHADNVAAAVRREIDGYIARAGIDAPEAVPDPMESIPAQIPSPAIRSLDPQATGISTIVWCTGFRGDFGWISILELLDDAGQPAQEAGFARVPGIYFPGLPFSLSRRSGTLMAIAEEAERIAGDIQRVCCSETRPPRAM